jgi:hypothetical protein
MSPRDLAEDLAYVRTMAEEGAQAPLLGGRHLVFWGLLTAAASAAHWGISTGLIGDGWRNFWVLWAGYGLAGFVGSWILGALEGRKPGESSVGNRVDRVVWLAVPAAIFVISVGALARMLMEEDWNAPNTILPAAFAMYGVAYMVSGVLSRTRILQVFALFAWAFAIITSVYVNRDWVYLVSASGILFVFVIPGLILMAREPRLTV